MLRSRTVNKILSFLIAVVLWAYVIAVENPPTTERIGNIRVELLSVGMLNQNGLAVLEGENGYVEVVVSGTRADIARHKDQITATANLFGFGSGENYVTVDVQLHDSLTCTEVRPARILVNIESLVSQYRPVNITFTGDIEAGTEPGNITVQPDQIEVKGPKSLVESVSYVGVEIPYPLIGRSGTTMTRDALALNESGERVSNVNLSASTVNISVTLFRTKTVPLFVEITGQIGERYEMTMLEVPDTITIRGSETELAEIDYIEAEPIDISDVEVTSELQVTPVLPDGVEIANSSYGIHVKIGIKGISTSRFEYESQSIEIKGLQDGLKAYINTPALILRVAGKEAVLSSTEKEDFELFVDLEGLEEGTYVVEVNVMHDKEELNSIEVIPSEVHITINEDL